MIRRSSTSIKMNNNHQEIEGTKGVLITTPINKTSYSFNLSLDAITISKDMVVRAIPKYNEVGDPSDTSLEIKHPF